MSDASDKSLEPYLTYVSFFLPCSIVLSLLAIHGYNKHESAHKADGSSSYDAKLFPSSIRTWLLQIDDPQSLAVFDYQRKAGEAFRSEIHVIDFQDLADDQVSELIYLLRNIIMPYATMCLFTGICGLTAPAGSHPATALLILTAMFGSAAIGHLIKMQTEWQLLSRVEDVLVCNEKKHPDERITNDFFAFVFSDKNR